jgi:hypothetical protein
VIVDDAEFFHWYGLRQERPRPAVRRHVVGVIGVILTVVGVVVGGVLAVPLLSYWLEKTPPSSAASQAFSAGFAPFEELFHPLRKDQREFLEHEAQVPARSTDGAPPRVQVDLDAGVVIINDSADKAGELPYTGPTTERTGPETPEHRS